MKPALIEPLEPRYAPASLSIDSPSVNEGDGTVTFTVTLTDADNETVTVNYATADGSATSSGSSPDYVSTSGSLTFSSGGSIQTQTITVSIINDSEGEFGESFFLNLSDASGADISQSQGTASITDDDPFLSLSAIPVATEGNVARTIQVTLSLNITPTGSPVSVRVMTVDGSATADGGDYTPFDQVFTFNPGDSLQQTFDVEILGDAIDELDEIFSIRLAEAQNATAGPDQTVTLLNDDLTVSVDDTTVVVAEGDSGATQAVFTVRLSAISDHPVTVNYATFSPSGANVATAGKDYTPAIGSLTFSPGELEKTVAVDVLGERVGEETEFFQFLLSGAQNATIGTSTGRAEITDNDPKFTITAPPTGVTEGGTGTTSLMQFTITLDRDPVAPLTVNFKTVGGTANAGNDYVAQDVSLTFGPGELSKTVNVQVLGDAVFEGSETIIGQIVYPDGQTSAQGTGTILDDENQIVISDATLVEGDSGTANMIFVVRLLNRTTDNVSVQYATQEGSAKAGLDFQTQAATLDFGTSATQLLISIPVIGDLLHEGDQSFLVNLSSPSNAVISDGQATGTIVDNDPTSPTPTLSVSVSPVGQLEGGSGTTRNVVFTITLQGQSESPITVDFATMDGTATAGSDYVAKTQSVTFNPSSNATQTQQITVTINGDNDIEGAEKFSGTLTNASGATITTESAETTILEDDLLVRITGFEELEGSDPGTPAQGKFTVTLVNPAGSLTAAVVPVTVNFTVTNGTAILGTDFTQVGTATSVTFEAGENSKEIVFDLTGDSKNEADEIFTVTLSSPTNAQLGSPSAATGKIKNDDNVTISIADATIVEGDSGTKDMTFTVTLSAASDQTITVTAVAANDTALLNSDFQSIATPTVSFAPGETSKTVTVKIIGDLDDEATETFKVNLSNATGTGVSIDDGQAIGTITDNDQRTISIGDAQIVEGNSGTTTLNFTVSLSSAAKRQITVDYATANDTATAGGDYEAKTGSLTFAVGETTKTISITINGDTTLEPDEFFFVRLSNAINGTIADGEAVGRIVDDERGYIVTSDNLVVTEPAADNTTTIVFKVTRTGDTSIGGTVTYATMDGSAKAGSDYEAANGTLTFEAGEITKEVAVKIKADLRYEGNETFTFKLVSGTNGAPVAGSDSQVATINADSDARPTLFISNPTSILEGDSGSSTVTFTLTLTQPNEIEDTIITYSTVAGTAEDQAYGFNNSLSADFTPKTDTAIIIPKGQTTATFPITVFGDLVYEGNETFSVKIVSAVFDIADPNPDVPVVVTKDTGTVTLVDNDTVPTITFGGGTNGDITAQEGSTNSTVTPKLVLSNPSELPVSVMLALSGTAVSGTDFTSPSGVPGTVTLQPGQTSLDLPFTILGNEIDQLDRTIVIKASNAQGGILLDESATVTIADDDVAPSLTITNGVQITEGDSGTSNLVFTVTMFGASDRTVTVNFATADGTAKSAGGLPDYVKTSGTLSFAPGETTKTISVPIIGDTWAEADETFTVKLTGAVNGTILSDTGTATILNGSDTVVGLVVNDAVSVENPLNSDNTAVTNPTITFLVELTKTLGTAVTFTAATRNGTAIATGASDSDYTALSQGFTIAAGATSASVAVTLKPDSVFEATEYFFLGIGGLSSNVAEARGEGRGVILNDDLVFVDTKTLRYIDEDGDLATVRITKGNLTAATISLGPVNQATGGRTLQLIDFTTNPALFNGTDLRITVEPQIGFAASGKTTDGRVDVGFIRGAIPDTNTLQFTRGIDFGSIVVPGDVGKITAGDQLITPAITGAIKVKSLGARGTATGAPDNISAFLSIVNSINVEGDLQGVVQVIGNEFGNINSLKIGGALRGGTDASKQSGIVFFTGTLGKATIGDIIGGAASDSGVINGNTNFVAKIGSLHVLGDIVGGTGTRSGRVVAKTIGSVVVDGDVIGGGSTGTDTDGTTPKGSDSGEILATSSITTVKVGGDVVGGIQQNTGIISSSGAIQTLRIGGSLVGGSGSKDSGVVIVNRTLSNLTIAGDVIGASGERSGSVQVGGTITRFTIGSTSGGGSVKGGTGKDSATISGGAGFNQTGDFVVSGGSIGSGLLYGDLQGGSGTGSGGVQVGGTLSKLEVRGSMIGGDSLTSGSGTTQTGFVLAGRLGTMTLWGDLRSGRELGANLADSGSIRVHENITSLTIYGDVIGNEANRAIISAGNNGPLVNGVAGPAISTLTVGKKTNGTVTGGNVAFLDVLAGYGEIGTTSDPRGDARNADAKIGTVSFLGDMRATNIVAGASDGTDGLFGTSDDLPLSGTNVTDKTGVISSIAKVIIGGNILGSDDAHGIVAQLLSSIKAANLSAAFSLTPKAGNDFIEIADETNVVANEVLVL